jgi:general secretion pathway protein F
MTKIIIDASIWLQHWLWLIILTIILIVIGIRTYLATPEGRELWDRWLLSVKFVGDFIKRVELSRFCRTLGTLLESGVPILKGISLASEVVSNSAVKDAAMDLYIGVRQGRAMSLLMKQSDIFPPLMVHLVSVGEETGALARMLLKIADDFEESIQNDTKMFLSLIEPVTIVFMGLVIGGIILSMLLAIFGINDVSF